MAYRKRNYRKRRSRKRNYRNSTAQRALALAKKANRTELKYADYSLTAGGAGDYTIIDLGSIAFNPTMGLIPNAEHNGRIGNTVQAKSMHFRTTVAWNPNGSTAQQVRIIVFKWLNEGSPTNVSDYLANDNIQSPKSVDHRFDSKTLYDRTFILSAENPKKIWNYKQKMNWPVHYENTTDRPDRGKLSVLFITDETSANVPVLSTNGTARFFYTDK